MKIVSKIVEVHVLRMKGKNLQFLLLKRSENELYPGIWQMVSGKIKNKEKAFSTALRELKEETGLSPLKLWIAPKINSFYDQQNDAINLIPIFAALIDSNSPVILSREHSQYLWLSKNETIKKMAWIEQRTAVNIIADYFLKEMNFLNFVEVKKSKKFYCG